MHPCKNGVYYFPSHLLHASMENEKAGFELNIYRYLR